METADGGTLFLDEVNEMGLGCQAKLLRALERREFRRVGGTRKIAVEHPPPRREQRRPRGARREPALPLRPLLPPQGRHAHRPAAAGPQGRDPGAGPALPRGRGAAGRPRPEEADAGRPGPARPLPLAGQHPRAPQLHGEPHPHQPAGARSTWPTCPRTCARSPPRPRSACAVGTRMEDAEREIIRRTVEAYPTLKEAARVLGIGLRTLHTKLAALPARRAARAVGLPVRQRNPGPDRRECRNGTLRALRRGRSAESARSAAPRHGSPRGISP